MTLIQELDARKRPPESLRLPFKKYQKIKLQDLPRDEHLIDLSLIDPSTDARFCHVKDISYSELHPIFTEFAGQEEYVTDGHGQHSQHEPVKIFEALNLPGLVICSQLLPPNVQIALLDRLLHRDVSNPDHLTNLHPFYHIPYESLNSEAATSASTARSFFNLSRELTIEPKDPSIHRPISVRSMLESKLRWVTLGGQYDWTNKVYPSSDPPRFPSDLVWLLERLFPEMKAQAAILNLYSPGDTLSMHRDVSEECDRGLISISLGCEAIFMVANEDATEVLPLRLRSGDVVFMNGLSRFAWHGVPKVLHDTCPKWLEDWPAMGNNRQSSAAWKGWMADKRINLNVRQMRE